MIVSDLTADLIILDGLLGSWMNDQMICTQLLDGMRWLVCELGDLIVRLTNLVHNNLAISCLVAV